MNINLVSSPDKVEVYTVLKAAAGSVGDTIPSIGGSPWEIHRIRLHPSAEANYR